MRERGVSKDAAFAICTAALQKRQPFEWRVNITKVDQDQRLVFGWLYQSTEANGTRVIDHSGEFIETPELEKAAYTYVEKSREASRMHKDFGIGTLVESVVFTKEKCQALGIPDGIMPEGLWVGFRVHDDGVWAEVKTGKLRMLSLGGNARRVAVEV